VEFSIKKINFFLSSGGLCEPMKRDRTFIGPPLPFYDDLFEAQDEALSHERASANRKLRLLASGDWTPQQRVRRTKLLNAFNKHVAGEFFGWKVEEWPEDRRSGNQPSRGALLINPKPMGDEDRFYLFHFLTHNGLAPDLAQDWILADDFVDGRVIVNTEEAGRKKVVDHFKQMRTQLETNTMNAITWDMELKEKTVTNRSLGGL